MSKISQQRLLSLANPISTLVGKEPEQFTRDDLINIIDKRQIEIISFLYPALNGELKQLRIPITSQYLTDLPADDRLLETRKIMHRCLYRF